MASLKILVIECLILSSFNLVCVVYDIFWSLHPPHNPKCSHTGSILFFE